MISEINAEMLLNYLYPELREEWVARFRGTFYRNYNDDALSIDARQKRVDLARDGFLKMLPQEFISPENETEHDDELKRRIAVLCDAFVPIDSFMFRQSLKMEREVSGLLELKTAFVLNRVFDVDFDSITNPMVRDAALLLPYARESRGDVNWVRRMLESLSGCKVELTIGRWSDDDNTRAWIPFVHYTILRNGLSQQDFIRLHEQIKELEAFVMEHWMPAEVHLRIDLISHECDNGMILDYNSELK